MKQHIQQSHKVLIPIARRMVHDMHTLQSHVKFLKLRIHKKFYLFPKTFLTHIYLHYMLLNFIYTILRKRLTQTIIA